MMSTSQRTLVLIAILAFGAVCIALVSQYAFGLQPCAWCVLQRLIYIVIGIVCLVLAFLGPVLRRVGALLGLILSLCGVWAAYYQYTVASQLLSCAQTFADKFIAGSGLDAALPSVFGIYATCMDAAVKVLGVEYAVWSLVLFAILALLSLRALLRRA
ncbi:disulfide bond formation protein B [Bordetella genomosp. 8]|uniref:Disulfide bond formation protein B n=1 Tax=Bordetella genomosp. 8 TaxID=1416806 RepID=A0A1W6YLP6_9BORD|nr:disulfide bond formation protein B [Bordetella genomosp. 8]ARP81473.1 disulfide bond formation protein B [Bordetella genomosp. 8]